MNRIVKGILGVVGFLVIMLAIAMLLGWYLVNEESQKAAALEKIQNTHITLDDVMGKNLPPKPDQQENDKTIAGIDANNNTIRDDVELAVFEKYPNSARIRAGMLQYAQILQLQLTLVTERDTFIQTVRKEGLAYNCLGEANDASLGENHEEVRGFVVNNEEREKKMKEVYENMTTYSSSQEKNCDIDLSKLN